MIFGRGSGLDQDMQTTFNPNHQLSMKYEYEKDPSFSYSYFIPQIKY